MQTRPFTLRCFRLLTATLFVAAFAWLRAESPPPILSYQGRIVVDGINFDGTGYFKFALVSRSDLPGGATNYWSNDGSVATGEPAAAVPLAVTKGLYSVLLGDTTLTNMSTPIAPTVFGSANVWLRVWFSDRNDPGSFQALSPDQRIVSAGYALMAAQVPDGSITSEKLAADALQNAELPANPTFSGAVTATEFRGSGTNLTDLNADRVTSGTLADKFLSANVVVRDAAGAVQVQRLQAQEFVGGGTGLTDLDASGITKGILPDERLAAKVPRLDRDQEFSGTNTFTNPGNRFVGSGSGLNNLNASRIVSGTLSELRLTKNVALLERSTSQNFVGINRFNNPSNSFTGNGAGLTGLNALAITNGPLPDELLSSNVLRRDALGTVTATGNLVMPATAGADVGVLVVGASAFLHAQGVGNSFLGAAAGNFTLDGARNTGVGAEALQSITTGNNNTAQGFGALKSNSTGNNNVAIGVGSLAANTTGVENVAVGSRVLDANTSGSRNVGLGESSLSVNSTGSENVAVGFEAGRNLTTGNHNIVIGHPGFVDDSDTIRMGIPGVQTRTFIAGIYSNTIPDGIAVHIDAEGRLGVVSSSQRYKEAIRDMAEASDVVLSLRPVEFRYKPDIDPAGLTQFGLIAEEVNELAPQLVARDARGEIQTVRYEAVNAMLLNEVQKQHRHLTQQEQTIGDLRQQVGELNAKLAEVTALLHKVAVQLDSTKTSSSEADGNRHPQGL